VKQHTSVIGIVIGVCFGIALFVVITVIVCFCYKRRKVNKGEPLRFPNPTFGLPGGLKSVKVDGVATKWRSEEPLGSVGACGNDKLEPNRYCSYFNRFVVESDKRVSLGHGCHRFL